MNPFSTPTPNERLGIYLNDHRALVTAELALAQRCRSAHVGTELAHQLTVHIGAVTVDRDIIDKLLAALDHGTDHLKSFVAIFGERLGRFKLNGQLTGKSPLSPVVELEGLIASTHVRQVMWNALHNHNVLAAFDLAETAAAQAATASEQLDALRPYLHEAIDHALTATINRDQL